MQHIDSLSQWRAAKPEKGKAWLLLYKKGTPVSDCALLGLAQSEKTQKRLSLFAADVNQVRDIHPEYQIQTVPSLLEFENGLFKNVVKGCQTADFYTALFAESLYQSENNTSGKPAKNVTVYTTPTCPWCTTVKNYLRKNQIAFREVDVSRDAHAAQELVRKSGQQGVPQTEINGQIVVGFNQQRLNQLLEIQN